MSYEHDGVLYENVLPWVHLRLRCSKLVVSRGVQWCSGAATPRFQRPPSSLPSRSVSQAFQGQKPRSEEISCNKLERASRDMSSFAPLFQVGKEVYRRKGQTLVTQVFGSRVMRYGPAPSLGTMWVRMWTTSQGHHTDSTCKSSSNLARPAISDHRIRTTTMRQILDTHGPPKQARVVQGPASSPWRPYPWQSRQ